MGCPSGPWDVLWSHHDRSSKGATACAPDAIPAIGGKPVGGAGGVFDPQGLSSSPLSLIRYKEHWFTRVRMEYHVFLCCPCSLSCVLLSPMNFVRPNVFRHLFDLIELMDDSVL